jgi:hypothetical protein
MRDAPPSRIMIDQIVGQFLNSGEGKGVLDQLKQQGVDGPQAQQAVSATAEGAMQQVSAGGGGGLAGMLSGLTGGGGGQSAGMASQVTQFVAQKTGLSPAIAQTVVSAVLPKLLELFQKNTVPASKPSGAGLLGGLANMLHGDKR